MCGRYALFTLPEHIAAIFGTLKPGPERAGDLAAAAGRCNIAPTQPILIVRPALEGGRELATVKWGFVPHWQTEPADRPPPINARAETLARSPMFRDAFKHRRCIIPADAFYEWKVVGHDAKDKPVKQPMAVRARDRKPMALAGLWEPSTRRDEAGREQRLHTGIIITTTPNPLLASIHDRMPLVLPPEAWDAWLNPKLEDAKALTSLIKPIDDRGLEAYPVSRQINRPRADGPALLAPADESEPEPPSRNRPPTPGLFG